MSNYPVDGEKGDKRAKKKKIEMEITWNRKNRKVKIKTVPSITAGNIDEK